jgi:hypothetical protein
MGRRVSGYGEESEAGSKSDRKEKVGSDNESAETRTGRRVSGCGEESERLEAEVMGSAKMMGSGKRSGRAGHDGGQILTHQVP